MNGKRKSKGKSKGKGKGNSHRNGRTKRGGFFDMFKDSFSWFRNKSETNETTEPADWSFGLRAKLAPPPIPEGPTIIPGRPVQSQQATAAPATTPATATAAPVTATAAPVTAATAAGGRRLPLRTKKRSCKCK
jgi:hypothetical protein